MQEGSFYLVVQQMNGTHFQNLLLMRIQVKFKKLIDSYVVFKVNEYHNSSDF